MSKIIPAAPSAIDADFNFDTKTVLICAGIVVAVGAIYYYYQKNKKASAAWKNTFMNLNKNLHGISALKKRKRIGEVY